MAPNRFPSIALERGSECGEAFDSRWMAKYASRGHRRFDRVLRWRVLCRDSADPPPLAEMKLVYDLSYTNDTSPAGADQYA